MPHSRIERQRELLGREFRHCARNIPPPAPPQALESGCNRPVRARLRLDEAGAACRLGMPVPRDE